MDDCAIQATLPLWTTAREYWIAAIIIIFSIKIFGDGFSTICPPVEIIAESEVYDKMNDPVADINEHNLPWEVAQVVVIRQPHEDLEA